MDAELFTILQIAAPTVAAFAGGGVFNYFLSRRAQPSQIALTNATADKTQAEVDEIAVRVRKESAAHDEEISEDLRKVRKNQRELESQVDDLTDTARRLKRVANDANDRADTAARVATEANTRADVAARGAVTHLERITTLEAAITTMRLEIDGFPAYIKRLEDKLIAAGIDISNMHAPTPVETAEPAASEVSAVTSGGITVSIPADTKLTTVDDITVVVNDGKPSDEGHRPGEMGD